MFPLGLTTLLVALGLWEITEVSRCNSKMGQGGSTPKTALECLLNNFSDFQKRARGSGGPPPDTEVLRTFSELEWPTFNVGWPTERTFDLPIFYVVQRVVYQVPQLDQMVYIDVWVDTATERPGYIQPCQPDRRRMQCSVCVAARGGGRPAARGDREPRSRVHGEPRSRVQLRKSLVYTQFSLKPRRTP